MSLLSIKSAIIEDTGNYTCILPATEHTVTASLHILKGNSNIFLETEVKVGINRNHFLPNVSLDTTSLRKTHVCG